MGGGLSSDVPIRDVPVLGPGESILTGMVGAIGHAEIVWGGTPRCIGGN